MVVVGKAFVIVGSVTASNFASKNFEYVFSGCHFCSHNVSLSFRIRKSTNSVSFESVSNKVSHRVDRLKLQCVGEDGEKFGPELLLRS